MTIHIIGLGESAKHYAGQSPSIGVNDCGRWGFEPEYLLLLNTPKQFPPDRFSIIRNSRPKIRVFSNSPDQWSNLFGQNIGLFNSRSWSHSNRLQKISPNYYYHSKTSPFAAISLAYSFGYKEIVLWGVDFINHRVYSPGKDPFTNEIMNYKSFCMSLNEVGVKVFLGCEGSNLKFLPIWQEG